MNLKVQKSLYDQAYKLGFDAGREFAFDHLLQVSLETLVMLFVDAECSAEDIQELADQYSRCFTYNCYHPEEWKQMVEQARKEKNINIIFKKQEAE